MRLVSQSLSPQDQAKKSVGYAAVDQFVRDGMSIGIGSGTTMAWFVQALGEKVAQGLDVRGVPTSRRTRKWAEDANIRLVGFEDVDRLDLVVDGADEVDHDGYMIKGGGGALLWERIVADAGDHYVCVGDSGKLVETLGAYPLPVEVVQYGYASTLRSVRRFLGELGYSEVHFDQRMVGDTAGTPAAEEGQPPEPFVTDSGNFLVDLHLGKITDAQRLDREIVWIPGVVETGLFTGIADEVMFSDAEGEITVMSTSHSPAGRPSTTVRGVGNA